MNGVMSEEVTVSGEAGPATAAAANDIVGLLVLLGAPTLIVAKWRVAVWLVESSTASAIADAAPLSVPWWPIAVGLMVLMIAGVWRQTVSMREDVEGLV